MSIRIYNVLSRQKEAFVPLTEGKVNIYVCGPTVYDNSHTVSYTHLTLPTNREV